MCFCFPSEHYIVDDDPRKTRKKKKRKGTGVLQMTEVHLVQRGDVFVAVDHQQTYSSLLSSYNPPPRLCYPSPPPQQPFAAIPTTAFASTSRSSRSSIGIPLSGMYANATTATSTATATAVPESLRRQQPTTTVRITPYDSTDTDIDIDIGMNMNTNLNEGAQQGGDRQFWVREVDGSYTLRDVRDIMENCQPGSWMGSVSGYPYFVREMPGPAV